ncbi:MAG: 3-phosphoserine/phosphohydroxythreonine transaminase [Anaerolineales bacterium]|nr:3-phosphoserine/phosphohydroxythreonine transaminase [Anaerolineales bacterium]
MTVYTEPKTKRVCNFAAGPAVLPLPVLEKAQADLLNFNGSGMSVLEMSHRSAAFEGIIQRAEADLRTLYDIPANYKILFLQGGANLQFGMIPLNLRAKDASIDAVLTGNWSKAAIKEAKKSGPVKLAATTEATNFNRIPAQNELQLDPKAAYLYFTSNETIQGVEWRTEPVPPDGVPLVCDASSDFVSRPLDISKYGLLYAGAQKNAGPAGVTVVILREDLLERVPPDLVSILDYKLMADKQSLYNTPPCFAIYIVGLVAEWLLELGGLAQIAKQNQAKSDLIYSVLDAEPGFFNGHAEKDSRSRMNITFRLPSEDLEKKFVKDAAAEGLLELKGHRSVGGLRVSLYNAQPMAAVEALAGFMKEFRKKNG